MAKITVNHFRNRVTGTFVQMNGRTVLGDLTKVEGLVYEDAEGKKPIQLKEGETLACILANDEGGNKTLDEYLLGAAGARKAIRVTYECDDECALATLYRPMVTIRGWKITSVTIPTR